MLLYLHWYRKATLILYELYFERKIGLCISNQLLSEYFEVLKRDKFSRFTDFVVNANLVLNDIHQHAELFEPRIKVDIIKDADDNMLLELAIESDANYIVTGNRNDFTISSYQKTKIVSPKDYWNLYKPQ